MSTLRKEITAKDHHQGNLDAPIQLVEYGDYECPYCAEALPTIQALQENFGENLLVVFRNFPLEEMHPDANNAALAAEAAARQNKFWEMHDLLYENQDRLDAESLFGFAEELGLDMEKFQQDLQDSALQQHIEDDLESGMRSGVNGTPSFFINGTKYNGEWDYTTLESVFYSLIGG